ncbi:MAG: hypothetical protein WCP52_01080 [Bacteroidota bacterium]
MKKSDSILKILTEVESLYKILTFPENDIRRDFHGMVLSALQSFYCGYIASELSQKIADGKVAFDDELIENKTHIDKLLKTYEKSDGTIYSINRHLILTCWTSFEVSLTTLSEALLPDTEKESLSLNEYVTACKILKGEKIKDETLQKLKDTFSKKHLTHIEVWRKFNALVKNAEKAGKTYSRVRQDDILFLQMYGTMRNSLMHSNGIYFGRYIKYLFNDYEIEFQNGKTFGYKPAEELPKFYTDLMYHLSNIYLALTDLYYEIDFISYPDTETI